VQPAKHCPSCRLSCCCPSTPTLLKLVLWPLLLKLVLVVVLVLQMLVLLML
jgi:hypothetical protein